MDNENIFRKVAMERLSSPENLDQVMRVVPAKNWIALVCLILFVAALGCWACFARIARQAEGRGVLAQDSAAEVIARFSAGDAGKIQPGMKATITLDSGTVRAGMVESVLRANENGSIVRIRLNNGEAEAVPRTGDATEESGTVRVTIESIAPIRLMFSGG